MESVIDSAELRKAVGSHVRRLRLLREWNQDELAEMAHISTVQLSRIENGHQLPSLETAFEFSDAFGVPIETFRQIPSVAS
jgi:transcriptional regulator with XRE-family HTH domain